MEVKTRSLLKAISWRIAGSLDTFVISLIITGELTFAASISAIEFITKTCLYYVHERIWLSINWGRNKITN